MKRILSAWLLAASSSCVFLAAADIPGRYFRFEHLTPEFNGKPIVGASSMLQDREGFLWFGTGVGLVRYDGYHFNFFSPNFGPDALSSPSIVYTMVEDRAGDIWLGTDGRGLFKFDKNQETFHQFRHNPNDPGSLSGDIVLSIQEDKNGALWVGTRLNGLNRFDKASGTFTRFPLDIEDDTIWDLLVDRKGFLWVGTQDNGLFKLDPEKSEIINYRFILENPHSLGSNTVWTIVEDRKGVIWIGTKSGGLNRYNPEENRFVRFYGDSDHPRDLARNTITAIAEDQAGRLWLGTSWDGLRIWDRKSDEYTIFKHDPQDSETVSDDNITFIYQDASGIMWIGTTRGGINKCLANQVKFDHFKHNPNNPMSLSHNEVNSLWLSRSGRLWVGLKEGLDRIDEKTGQIRHFIHDPSNAGSLSHNWIQAICEDRAGGIWVGTEAGGIDHVDPQKGIFSHYQNSPENANSLSHNRVFVLWPDKENPNVLWIGTQQGLNKFDIQLRHFTRFLYDPSDPSSLRGDIVTAIYEDRAGFLWVGTRSGLNRMDKTTGTCEHYIGDIKNPPGKSINDNIIHCIYEDGAGIIWVGTDRGLNRLDRKKGEWRYFSSRDGLPGDVALGILEDESGSLWVSTNLGLARFDLQAEVFTSFGTHDGIQGDQFNRGACFKNPGGRMFFGGVNGYNAFDPKAIKKNPFIPPVVWTAFLKNNQVMKLDESLSALPSLRLSYPIGVLTFEFAALYYANPALNQFSYMLEPRDRDWISLGSNNSISVSDIKPGDYMLRVRGTNPDGVGGEEGLQIRMKVAAPFWRTTWFAVIVLVFLVTGVISIVQMWRKLRSAYTVVGEDLEGTIEKYRLTTREKEILLLILRGARNKDIEKKLFISGSTVRNHISNIYQKLSVKSRLELVNLINKDARKNL